MKKFMMVSLATAGILLLTGGLFALISSVAGGYRFSVLAREIELDDKIEYFIEDVGEAVYDSTNGKWGHLKNHDSHSTNYQVAVSEIQEQVDAGEIRKIEMEAGAGNFVIKEKESQDGKIDITALGIGDYNYSVRGGTLHIEGFKGLKWGDTSNFDKNKMEVCIPAGSSLEELEIELGAGVMDISGFSINKLETDVGAGSLLLYNMEIGKLSVDVGAGEVEVSDTIVRDAEIAVAMGECSYDGSITGELEAECAMGNLQFKLTGSENDHNYEIECAAGNVTVGSFSVTAVAGEKTINNNAASKYEIDCGMGNITIEFED